MNVYLHLVPLVQHVLMKSTHLSVYVQAHSQEDYVTQVTHLLLIPLQSISVDVDYKLIITNLIRVNLNPIVNIATT